MPSFRITPEELNPPSAYSELSLSLQRNEKLMKNAQRQLAYDARGKSSSQMEARKQKSQRRSVDKKDNSERRDGLRETKSEDRKERSQQGDRIDEKRENMSRQRKVDKKENSAHKERKQEHKESKYYEDKKYERKEYKILGRKMVKNEKKIEAENVQRAMEGNNSESSEHAMEGKTSDNTVHTADEKKFEKKADNLERMDNTTMKMKEKGFEEKKSEEQNNLESNKDERIQRKSEDKKSEEQSNLESKNNEKTQRKSEDKKSEEQSILESKKDERIQRKSEDKKAEEQSNLEQNIDQRKQRLSKEEPKNLEYKKEESKPRTSAENEPKRKQRASGDKKSDRKRVNSGDKKSDRKRGNSADKKYERRQRTSEEKKEERNRRTSEDKTYEKERRISEDNTYERKRRTSEDKSYERKRRTSEDKKHNSKRRISEDKKHEKNDLKDDKKPDKRMNKQEEKKRKDKHDHKDKGKKIVSTKSSDVVQDIPSIQEFAVTRLDAVVFIVFLAEIIGFVAVGLEIYAYSLDQEWNAILNGTNPISELEHHDVFKHKTFRLEGHIYLEKAREYAHRDEPGEVVFIVIILLIVLATFVQIWTCYIKVHDVEQYAALLIGLYALGGAISMFCSTFLITAATSIENSYTYAADMLHNYRFINVDPPIGAADQDKCQHELLNGCDAYEFAKLQTWYLEQIFRQCGSGSRFTRYYRSHSSKTSVQVFDEIYFRSELKEIGFCSRDGYKFAAAACAFLTGILFAIVPVIFCCEGKAEKKTPLADQTEETSKAVSQRSQEHAPKVDEEATFKVDSSVIHEQFRAYVERESEEEKKNRAN